MQLPIFILLLLHATCTLCFTPISSPYNDATVTLRGTRAEFLTAYSSIFKMSDGSAPPIDDASSTLSIPYIDTLLRAIGGSATETPNNMIEITMQSNDLVQSILMAVVGNFVTTGATDGRSPLPSGDLDSLPSVVVDVYTGRLQLVSSFSTLRSYFLETLLIISVIAIARLALVRNVTAVYTPAPGEVDKSKLLQPAA